MVDQETLIKDINTTHEESNGEKTKMEDQLRKWSDIERIQQEIHEYRDALKALSTAFTAERERLIGEKNEWKRKNELVLEQEREVKKFDIRRSKVQTAIQNLKDTIRNEVST